MDTSGFSQVGRYGTISLMKRNEPNAAVTGFGIDTEELTFGRDPTCSVRLYYPDVGLVHCKIVFEERKAFLVVLGASGLLVDGCKVYANSSPSHIANPTTIPLSNNSEFEIHGKRFRFTYPPKELRAALMATPARPGRRALRLSMIHSAQVFSPRPSQDPRENLRILRSPLKNTFKSSALASPSMPLRTSIFPISSQSPYTTPPKHEPVFQNDEEEDHIILVDGNHPRVVEEDKDLVILEDVEMPRVGTPTFTPTQPQPQSQVQFQTPVRQRSLSRNTLHRAVLIRSAQRAVMKAESAEREREEEEEEEMEVLGAVAADIGSESETDEDVVMHDMPNEQDVVEGGNEDESESDGEEEHEEDRERGRTGQTSKESQKSVWRKSLERIWPFRSSSPDPKEENDEEDDQNADADSGDDPIPTDDASKEDYNDENENQDMPAPLPTRAESHAAVPMQTPVRRTLGSFITPQVHAKASNTFAQPQDVDVKPQPGRFSLGGGEARRIAKSEHVWRVNDIVIPTAGSTTTNKTSVPGNQFTGPGVPGTSANARTPALTPARRQVVGDEERKAIQERRRSALRGGDTFFPGGVPGMGSSPTPIKALGFGSSPAKFSASSSTSASTASSSTSPSKPSPDVKMDVDKEDDEQLDTKSLLERMKETVEGMKRRRSMAPGTPIRGGDGPGVGPGGLATPARVGRLPRLGVGRDTNPQLADAVMAGVEEVDENEMDEGGEADGKLLADEEDGENKGSEDEVFSLLRPVVVDKVRLRDERPVEVPRIPLPDGEVMANSTLIVPLPVTAEDNEELNVAPKRGSRARLLRGTRPSPSPAPHGDDNAGQKLVDQNIDANAKGSKPKAVTRRIRTPQPEIPKEQAEVEGEEEHDQGPTPLARSTTRRARKPTVEPESETQPETTAGPPPVRRSRRAATVEPEGSTVAAAPAPRRGRKLTVEPEGETTGGVAAKRGRKAATAEPEEADEISPLPAPTKRGIRKVATPASETEADEDPQPQPAVRRGRTPKIPTAAIPPRTGGGSKGKNDDQGVGVSGTKRGMKTKAGTDVEVGQDDDDDELDSIDQEESEPAAAIPKSKGRKKATAVTEMEDESLEKVPAAVRGVKAKTTTLKTPAARARGPAKKTPASAPAMIPQGVDKENTPGSEESSSIDAEEPAKVKMRVSKTTRKATSGTAVSNTAQARNTKATQEVAGNAPESEVPPVRVMRATRARTKT